MELNFDFEPKITKDYLLSKCSEETYMQFYLGIQVKKGLFKSPLRKDHRPTCSFIEINLENLYSKILVEIFMVILLMW